MTNEEMLLRVMMGEEMAETAFHPQTNKQAYLAYGLGLLTDFEALPKPRTNEEALLYLLAEQGFGGGNGMKYEEFPVELYRASESTKFFELDAKRVLLSANGVWLFDNGEFTKLHDSAAVTSFLEIAEGVIMSGTDFALFFDKETGECFEFEGTNTAYTVAAMTHDGYLLSTTNTTSVLCLFHPESKTATKVTGEVVTSAGVAYAFDGLTFVSSTTSTSRGLFVLQDGNITKINTDGTKWECACECKLGYVFAGQGAKSPAICVKYDTFEIIKLLTFTTSPSYKAECFVKVDCGVLFWQNASQNHGINFFDDETGLVTKLADGYSFTVKLVSGGAVFWCVVSTYKNTYYFDFAAKEATVICPSYAASSMFVEEVGDVVFVQSGTNLVSVLDKETKTLSEAMTVTNIGTAQTLRRPCEDAIFVVFGSRYVYMMSAATRSAILVCSNNGTMLTTDPVSRGVLVGCGYGIYLCHPDTGEVEQLSEEKIGYSFEYNGNLLLHSNGSGSSFVVCRYDDETNEVTIVLNVAGGTAPGVIEVEGGLIFVIKTTATSYTSKLLFLREDLQSYVYHGSDELLAGRATILNNSWFENGGEWYFPVFTNPYGSLVKFDVDAQDFVVIDPNPALSDENVNYFVGYTDDDTTIMVNRQGVYVWTKQNLSGRQAYEMWDFPSGGKFTRVDDNVEYALSDKEYKLVIPIYGGDAEEAVVTSRIIVARGGIFYDG